MSQFSDAYACKKVKTIHDILQRIINWPWQAKNIEVTGRVYIIYVRLLKIQVAKSWKLYIIYSKRVICKNCNHKLYTCILSKALMVNGCVKLKLELKW